MSKKKKITLFLLSVIFLLLIIIFIYYNTEKIVQIISPFILAIVITYLISPTVKKLESRNISKSVSIIGIYCIFIIALIGIIVFIIPELINNTRELGNTLPEMTTKYQMMFNKFMSFIKTSNYSEEIKNTLIVEIETVTGNLEKMILENLKLGLTKLIDTITMLFGLIVALVIAYYFIKDEKLFRETFLSFTPRKWRNEIITTGREINNVLKNFIQGQLITAIIIGILETIGLLIVRVKYPLILGLLGGVANIIPYFGPLLGAVPAIAVALIDSPLRAFWTAIIFIVVQQIDNTLISPKIIEGRLGIHPITTIMAVLIGGEFFGIVGMLFSVPITAIIKILLKHTIEAIV